MPIDRATLARELIRLRALLEARTAEANQLDGAAAFCENLLKEWDAPAAVPPIVTTEKES